MKKTEFKKYNEVCYEDVCDNGLKIFVWHKPSFKTTACLFGTPFGSFGIKQQDNENNFYEFEKGIAHFLEHKLFESDRGDVLSEFSELGANVNAFTSYNETVYYFNTCNENIDVPLNLLLDFVQDLNISDESVEKEKGIIIQELMMYMQNPDSRIYFETFKSMYHTYPLKDDIGGDEASVSKITKNDLENCYNLNYHPSNMIIVVATDKNPEYVIKLIKENQNNKKFTKINKINTIYDREPSNVLSEYKLINMDINETKCCVGIKLTPYEENKYERIKKDWMLNLSLEAYFSSLNKMYQTWIDDKKITAYFSFEADLGNGHSYLLFNDNCDNPEEFKNFVLSELENFKNYYINDETLKMLKNKNLGQLIRILNKPENMIVSYFRNYFYGISIFESIDILKDLTSQECYIFINSLNFSNNCLTVIKNVENE